MHAHSRNTGLRKDTAAFQNWNLSTGLRHQKRSCKHVCVQHRWEQSESKQREGRHALALPVDADEVQERCERLCHHGVAVQGRHSGYAQQRPHDLHQQSGAGVGEADVAPVEERVLVVHLEGAHQLESGVAPPFAANLVLEFSQADEHGGVA